MYFPPVPLFMSNWGHIFPFITEEMAPLKKKIGASQPPLLSLRCWERPQLLEVNASKFHHDCLYMCKRKSYFDTVWQVVTHTRLFIISINGHNAQRLPKVTQKNLLKMKNKEEVKKPQSYVGSRRERKKGGGWLEGKDGNQREDSRGVEGSRSFIQSLLSQPPPGSAFFKPSQLSLLPPP